MIAPTTFALYLSFLPLGPLGDADKIYLGILDCTPMAWVCGFVSLINLIFFVFFHYVVCGLKTKCGLLRINLFITKSIE